MTTALVPEHARTLALQRLNHARTVHDAQGVFTTVEQLERAIAALQQDRSSGADMLILLRQQRASAIAARKEAARRLPTPPDLSITSMQGA